MPINLADRLSAITTDSAGITHVVWVENTSLWHAVYNVNSGTWENAQAIANVGNQSLTSLNLIANDKLIQPPSGESNAAPAPGLVVVYQQGSDNDSDIFYTAARYNSGGRTEWLSTPQALTADQVGDLAPRAIAEENGTVFVVGQKVNVDSANNQAIREDTDLYYQSFTVNQNQFSNNQNSSATGNISQRNSYNYLGRNLNTPAANYTVLSAGETNFLGNKPTYQGSGFNWNASNEFNINTLSFLLAKQLGKKADQVLKQMFGPMILSISLQGSAGNNPEWSLFGGGDATNGRLLLNALATIGRKQRRDIGNSEDSNRFDQWRNRGRGALSPGSQEGFDLSFTLSSLYSYGNSNANSSGKFPLYVETGGALASFASSIPLFGFDSIKGSPLNFNFGLFFNAGVALQWQVTPKDSDTYPPLLAPYLNLSGNTDRLLIVDGFSNALPTYSELTAGLALISNLEAAFASIDKNSDVELESLLLGIPVTLGFEGTLEIPYILKIFGSIGFFADGTFTLKKGGPSSITVGMPVNLTVSVLGLISGRVAAFITATETWPQSSENSQTNLQSATNGIASVDGFLLTIDFTQSLEPNLNLNPTDFTVTVINANGQTSIIPVFGVVVQTDNQGNGSQVILRLEQEIPYTTLNDQPFSNITVNYNGNQLGGFTSSPVVINSANTLIYTYNPTSGTDNDYTQNNQQITIAFNGSLDPDILAFEDQLINWFTVTNSNNQNVAISSVAVSQTRINLTLATNAIITPGENYTVQYNPDADSEHQLKTANQEAIAAFTVSNATPPTARGLVNSTFVNIANVPTQPVLSKLTSDFAQDSSPALALTSQGDILLAWSSDTPPITPISVLAEGDYLYLVFADNLKNDSASPPGNDQFTIKTSDGNITNPTNVSQSQNTIILTIDNGIDISQITGVDYNLSATNLGSNLYLSDATNTEFWVPSFTSTVEVSSSITTAPIPLQGSVISKLITIPFNQTLNTTNNTPNGSQFQVVVNGNTANPINVTSVTVDDTSVTLTLETIVGQGNLVSVTYTPNSNGVNNLVSDASTPQAVQQFTTNNFLTTASSTGTVIKTAFSPFGDSGISSITTIPGTSGINSDVVATLYTNPTTNVAQNIVAWVNVDSSALALKSIPGQNYNADEAELINTALSQSDIYYSVLGSDNQWSLAAPIVSNQAGQDQKVTLGAGPNGSLLAAWLNTQLDSNGNPNTTIQGATFDGTQWIDLIIPDGQNSTINPNSFSELSISEVNGQPAIFWTESKPASYSNLVLTENPLIYLRLGELNGTTAINQGQLSLAGDGTYGSGGYTLGEVGALANTNTNTGDFNPAVLFNGGGVTINSPVAVPVQGFSVEFWFKLPTAGGLVSLANLAGVFNLYVIEETLTFALDNSSNSVITQTITSGNWHYLVGTYDPVKEILALYLDGQLVGSLENVAFDNLPKSGTLTLAGSPGPVYLDEFAFYNSVLSHIPTSPSSGSPSDNLLSLTGSQLVDSVLGVNEIGARYQAQFFEPVTAGPETNYSVWDSNSNSWQSPVSINPIDEVIPTILSAANNPVWDIVSGTFSTNNNQIAPNGKPDTIFQVNLTGKQGSEIVGFSVTTDNGPLWSVGTNGVNNTVNGLQLGVILAENTDSTTPQLQFISGDRLLNSLNPTSSFSHQVMGATETFTIFVDTEGSPLTSPATVNIYLQGGELVTFTSLSPIPNQGGPVPANSPDYLNNQVLGIATVKEANDASLSLVDSGFVINTDNPAIAVVMASGFSNGNLAYVAVGNRGYASQGNLVKGSIQILFAGGDVLGQKSSNPLTTTDLSGNADGVLITGINDTGDINNDVPMALVTGDVDGDGVDDLVIGDANANGGTGRIYVIKGSYLASLQNQKQIIDLSTASQWPSNQGFVIDGTDIGGGAGFSLAIGNFTGNGPQIAFGAPFAKNSDGVAVGKVYLVSPSNPSQLSPPIHTGNTFSLTNPQNQAQTITVGETAGYSLGVSRHITGSPVTFTNNPNDDLFIGSSTYGVTINNQWVGKSALPSGNQGDYPDTTMIAAGAVHVFSQPSGQSFGKVATYTGPNVPAANGVGANYLAGAAIALGDFTDLDGDGQQDLAISALGVNGSAGAVYVLSGGKAVANSSDQALNEVSNLIINGGIAGGLAGMTIMTPGDVNGDGYQDFLITAPQAGNGTGQSYLLFGPLDLSTEIVPIIELSAIANDSKQVFLLNGSLPNQLAGTAVASLGNLTGQKGSGGPIDSFLISAPNAQQFYVVYGQAWLADDGSLNLADVSSDNGFVIDGNLIGNPPATFETTSQYIDTTPAIIVDGSNLYLAYKGFGGNNQIYFTASTNNGQSWDWEVQLPQAAQTIFPPAIAFYNNVLYLAYVDLSDQLYIATSQNGGQNWNEPFAIGGSSSTPPTLVVYQGTLSLLFAADNDNSNILQFYLNSSNEWIYANEIGSNQTAISAISATVLGDTLYLAYKGGTISNPNVNDYLTSTNNPDLSASDWNSIPIPGVISQGGPSLTNDGTNLYLSYIDSTKKLNLVSSSNGSKWSASQAITNNISQAPPAIAFGNNKLYLSYPGPQGSQEINVTSFPLPFTGNIVGNGSLVRFLGDVNGDGFADVFSGGNNAGAIIFGNSTKDLLTTASGSEDLVIWIPNATLRDAISLGDFNGDGLNDLGVLDNKGNFSVVLGNTSLGDLKTLSITASSSPVVINQVGGVSKSMAIGDYNGDGYDDVLLWGDNGNQVAWGNSTGVLNSFTNIDYPETQTTAIGVDLNGDGITEIAIGSDARKIAGQISTAGSFSLLPNPTTSSVINTLAGANQLQNIGDFNGDGIADLAVLASNYYAAAIGEPNNLPNYLSRPGNQGGVFIYYGTTQGLINSPQPDVILAAPFTNPNGQISTYQLSHIAKAGDVNGDGFDDLLIGSPYAVDAENNQGSVFVVFGGDDWNSQSFDLGQLRANQSQGSSANGFAIDGSPNSQAGIALSGGGDVNGDGFDDFIIGAPGENSLQYNQKSVFIENGTVDNIDQKYGFIYYFDGNQTYSLGTGDQPWNSSSGVWINQMAVQWGANEEPAQVVVGLDNGYIYYYNQNTSSWEALNNPPTSSGYGVTNLSVQWSDDGNPNIVFSYKNGEVWYYQGAGNGGNWSEIGSLGSDVTQMAVQWGANGEPTQIVAGLANGAVIYYTPQSGWQTINNFGKSVTQLSVQWQDNGNPNIVVGLDNSEVQSYQGSGNGGSWTQLHDDGWVYPVQQLAVQWISEDAQPLVVVGLGTDDGNNGTVWYYQGSGEQGGWTYLSGLPSGAAIAQMSVQWNVSPSPSSSNNVSNLKLVVGQADSTVTYYNGSGWTATPAINSSHTLNAMAVQWSANGEPQITVGLGDSQYPNGELWYLPNPSQPWQQLDGSSPVTQIDSLWTESLVPNSQTDNLSYVFFGSDFNQTVNQTGTIGDDVMLGSPTGESFLAGQGDDQIYTKGGLDVVYAGPDDDWVSVSNTYFRRLDGGTGFDILALQGYNGQNWDITTLSPGLRLQDFETIDIRDYGANQLTLNSLSVINLSSNNTIIVLMDESGDSLELSSDFSADGTTYQYGQRFYQYKSNNSAAIVLVNQPTVPSFNVINQNKPTPILSASNAEDNGSNLTGSNQDFLDFSDPNAPIKLFVSNPRISEAAGEVNFVIERAGNLDKYVLVSYLTQDRDGKAGDRYLPIAGQLIFNPGETQKTVTVKIPNDNIYTGDRQFGLLVSLLEESLELGNWDQSFSFTGDSNGAQIRNWNYLVEESGNSLMAGVINFSSTVNDGQAQVNLDIDGVTEFNDFFGYDHLTRTYKSLMLDGMTGAKFTAFDGQNNPQRVEIELWDGDRGDADGLTNGLVETKGYLSRVIPGLLTNDNRVFWAPTSADGQVQLRLISSPNQNYELGWIAVDNADGLINGLRPDDPGYEAAALARKQIIFNSQSSASTQALTRSLAQQSFSDVDKLIETESQLFGSFSNSNLEANRYYLLYSQQGSQTTFSINVPPTVETDSRGYHQLNFNGITAEIGSNTLVVPGRTGQPITTEVSISRAGAYDNFIALYQVDSLTGGLDVNGDRQVDLKPGDTDYVQTALNRAQDLLNGVSLNTPDGFFSTTKQTINLLGNNMYGMVIIPNATVEQVLSQNPTNNPNLGPVALFSFNNANPGSISQMSRLGSNLFGFEDIVGGGDRDYNDVILQFSFSTL